MKAIPFTTEQIESHARAIIARLTPEDISYAVSEERGEYQGFAALHDLMDANMLLPSIGEFDGRDEDEEYVDSICAEHNRIMDRINVILITPQQGDLVRLLPEYQDGEGDADALRVVSEVSDRFYATPADWTRADGAVAPRELVRTFMVKVISRPAMAQQWGNL